MNRLRSDCMNCLVKKASDVPENATELEKITYMQKVFRILADAPLTMSSPEVAGEISRLQAESFGVQDPYAALKSHFNQLVLDCSDSLRSRIADAEDPLLCAIQYALVGNYIDFGALSHVDEGELLRQFSAAQEIRLDPEQYHRLLKDLETAQNLLYITDNCGEIAADKLVMEVLHARYPKLCITAMVRGKPVLNDATMQDAQQVGLDKLARVIDNGNGVAGTSLAALSPEARSAMDSADVILAKGQGNFETLRKCGKNIYYLFLCKCDMFARQFGVKKFSAILIHDSCYQEKE